MRKIAKLLLSFMIAFSFCACSSSNSTTESKKTNTYPISIDNFKWSVDKTTTDGQEGYAVTLTNTSDYDVLSFEIVYEYVDWDPDEDSLFNDIYKAYGSSADVTADDEPVIYNPTSQYVKADSKSDKTALYVGFGNIYDSFYTDYESPTDEQFNELEPGYLYLQIVKGDTLYHCTYNINDEEWESDEPKTEALNEWPDNEVTKLIDKPEDCTFISSYDEDNKSFDFTAYNVDLDYCNDYIDKLLAKGFTYNEGSYESLGYPMYTNGDHTIILCYSTEGNLQIILMY